MANNNMGAKWLSTEEQIRNPFYGDAMLTCGSVVDILDNVHSDVIQ
jgi:Cu(I)/Ag(I) efflux system membrane fusion protein